MTDTHKPEPKSDAVRRRLENTKRRDTPAEMALRRELHRRGLRYRVDHPIPGVTKARPDIVFTRTKVAIFVDGCFWHSCPDHGTIPNNNREWWVAKLSANQDRDRRHDGELTGAGWTVLRFWEHDDLVDAADAIQDALQAPGDVP